MSKEKNELKLPKRLAGVKIPKDVRRGELGQFIASPAGAALVAESLLVLSAALVGRHEARPGSRTRKAAKKAADGLQAAKAEAAATTADASARIVHAFHAAADTFRREMEQDSPDLPPPPPELKRVRKKKAAPAPAVVAHSLLPAGEGGAHAAGVGG